MSNNWHIANSLRQKTGIEMTGDEVKEVKESAYNKIWYGFNKKGYLLPCPYEETDHFESILKHWFNNEKNNLLKITLNGNKKKVSHLNFT